MAKILSLYSSVVLAIGVLMMVAMLVGRLTYKQPALLTELTTCNFKCWKGIEAGKTDLGSAYGIVNRLGYSMRGASYIYTISGDCGFALGLVGVTVYQLEFFGCGSLRVGDLMLLFGPPSASEPIRGHILYWHNVLFYAQLDDKSSPTAVVSTFDLNVPDSNLKIWHGFVPVWFSCRLAYGSKCPL